jgi:hypothetical protein
MRNLTPEQIGLDYPALLELLGKERALDLIGKERALDLIGADAVRQWLRRHEQAASQGPGADPSPEKPDNPSPG